MRRTERGTLSIFLVAHESGWANAAAYGASNFGRTGLTHALAAAKKACANRGYIGHPGERVTSWGASVSVAAKAENAEPLSPAHEPRLLRRPILPR